MKGFGHKCSYLAITAGLAFTLIMGFANQGILKAETVHAEESVEFEDRIESEAADTVTQVDTYYWLMHTENLSGIVQTLGHMSIDDGAGMTYIIKEERPTGVSENIAVPTIDGKWAVPINLRTEPTGDYDSEAAEDALRRAQTFADAGSQLKWDPERWPPLKNVIVHQEYTSPYPITCSSFVGQVLAGFDFSHTTYVEDENTLVGDYVDFGAPTDSFSWQAWRLAKWLTTESSQTDVWLNDPDNPQYQKGDILFFSKQDPEGNDTTGKYYGNIFHTAIYLGDGKIIHSHDKENAENYPGVVVEELNSYLQSKLSFVARPKYTDYQKPTLSPVTAGDRTVSGQAQPNVKVTVSFADDSTVETVSDNAGHYRAEVPETVAINENDEMTVYSTNTAQNKSEKNTVRAVSKAAAEAF
ncbi:Ig-like domain-containing protein [Streptococcus sp. H31]|uniref:Ig-like domain-containing protein n=1 Tax=Streptococcus huangxiaojuni TaxID=3237239 RepID=UPI0034A265E5